MPWRLHDEERQSNVPLNGVTQIPDDVHRLISSSLEDYLTPEQLARAEFAIERSKREIRQRHLAHMRNRRRSVLATSDDGD